MDIEEITKDGTKNFKYFNRGIFPQSFEEKYQYGRHLSQWADMFQNKPFTCILAPRKHSKSTLTYSYLMWKIFRTRNKTLEVLYLSYKADLAGYHVNKLKNYLSINPHFEGIANLTPAETIAKYSWDNTHKIVIEPEGILSFKRGRHPDIVILDDVLADPTQILNLSIIEKINRIFFEQVMSLPKEGGELKIIGTAQTPNDFLFQIKDNTQFNWGMFPAIESEKKQTVLWEERFPYTRLMEIKNILGDKAFNKEYMLSPVYTEESFFRREELNNVVNTTLDKMPSLITKNDVIAGWDIGKKSHPAHFTIFEIIDGKFIQRFQKFMDAWDYTKQLEYVKAIMDRFSVDKCYFDATRGEFDKSMETGEMDKKFIPIIFTIKSKFSMATEFEKHVSNNNIELFDDRRMIDQILCVTNDLQAIETPEGHGDSFWSIALVFNYIKKEEVLFVGDVSRRRAREFF